MKKPNILVFITDQHRSDALGCSGNPVIKTPNIDALASSGINFEEAYVSQPISLPQRCSMITGLFPSAHGSVDNGIRLDKSLPVYPELLRRWGYSTYAAGKMHLNPISRGFDMPPYEPGEVPDEFPYCGFERVDFVEGEKSGYVKMLNAHGIEYRCKNPNDLNNYNPEAPFQTTVSALPEELHRTAYTADRMIEFIENHDGKKPFLAHCSFWDPHHPFAPPEPYDKMYSPEEMHPPIPYDEDEFSSLAPHFSEWRGGCWVPNGKSFELHSLEDWKKMKAHYYGMISLIDKHIGRVMDCLRRKGLYENTAVFFVSDHGELLGDHGIALKGPFMYQSLIKVPFIFSWPEKFGSNVIRSRVQAYDIMPTILELAGMEPPERVTARSMMPAIRGENIPERAVMCENNTEGKEVRTVLRGKYKLTCYADNNHGELFNLKDDPLEKNNLWYKECKTKSMMLLELNKLQMKAVKPPAEKTGRW